MNKQEQEQMEKQIHNTRVDIMNIQGAIKIISALYGIAIIIIGVLTII